MMGKVFKSIRLLGVVTTYVYIEQGVSIQVSQPRLGAESSQAL